MGIAAFHDWVEVCSSGDQWVEVRAYEGVGKDGMPHSLTVI